LELDVEIDTSLNYTIYEKIGDLNYRPTSSMSFEEFNKFQERQILKNYWKNRSSGLDGESAISGRNIIPPIFVSPVLDRIFGGSYVEITPRGFVTLDFGARWQRSDNPQSSVNQQRSRGGFEFDQQISMNVTGKVGEKLQVTANFDNNNSFDFENNLKVEFTGFEEDIIKKLEVGNISLPLNNSLISGAQNLFGIKAQMQFGKLFVTSVASTQRGKTQSVEVGGGGAASGGRQFEILAADYDENRHFFLGHFFREQYEKWLLQIPRLNSGINMRRVEVYVLNRQNNTQTLRNIVGLMDLGEPSRIYNDGITSESGTTNDNEANDLYDWLTNDLTNRQEVSINETFKDTPLPSGGNLENGLDYEKITQARKLDESEYSVHPSLGYISLNRKLQNDEALAVAYEYTSGGRPYQVGELSDDYANTPEDEVVFMKLLRPRKINIKDNSNVVVPTWDLMMKNIYYLNANQIEKNGFDLRIIYRDDQSNNDQPSLQDGTNTPLIELLGLDRLNSNEDLQRDGNFDFVEGVTVDVDNGLITFPFLEPFNTPLVNFFSGRSDEDFLTEKYVYDTLYRTTRADARQIVEKNKYFITGSMESGSSSEINLTGFNVSQGSVRVFAGGIALIEGQDFRVDYTFGKVTITNQGILNSGKKITVNYETADVFNFQSRTLLGSRFDYKLHDGVNFGATLLYLNERPLISRIATGSEPARNLKYGVDVSIQKESRMLTKLIDLMPIIQTKAPSNISFSAEFAQLRPGTSNKVNGESTSYIDDFENSAIPYGLGNPTRWKLAATPQTINNIFDGGDELNNLQIGYKRAKLAWYQIDNLFYRTGGVNNPGLSDEQLDNHYSRAVNQNEIFPFRSQNIGNNNERIFDLAYFPTERGPYNYNPDLNGNGTLKTPEDNWGGITQAIRTEVDFDKSNVEYIEFWMLDPFIDGDFGKIEDGIDSHDARERKPGQLIFHLGSINEDVIRDGRHAFENGLPSDGLTLGIEENVWGKVTTEQYLTNAFDNNGNRGNQDVGLDGLKDEEEEVHPQFGSFIDQAAKDIIREDVSADNFKYFLDFDESANIIERYKNFNGQDGNSPISNNSAFTPAGSTIPDNEDLNADNTLSELEEYYEYKIDIDRLKLNVGDNNIVDQIEANDPNGQGGSVTWYLFRIPIRQPDNKFGNINGFKSIRYIRTILTGFEKPVVLRLANFRMVGSEWRRYTTSLEGGAGSEDEENDPNNLTISVVNIEENSQGNATQPPYVLPPGIGRDRDNSSSIERQLNEQSLQLCVDNLEDNDARAAFKDHTLDLINYGRLKMFLHANSPQDLEDGAISAFVRLGRDENNYYEIEIPLHLTPPSSGAASEIWPSQNEIDIAFDQLFKLKKERIENGGSSLIIYPRNQGKEVGRHRIRVLGNPVINDISRIMIGVRNVKSDDKNPISACIWANEMRVTDFDSEAGWATNATFNAQLADLGSVTASTRYTSVGFGSIQSKISERTRDETTSYDVAANINLDKFLPEKAGLKIPMYASYERTNIIPRWDPASPDLTVDESLVLIEDKTERDSYKLRVEDNTIRRSINFSNVQKVKMNPDAQKHIYDIENFTFTYAFSDVTRRNYSISEYLKQNYRGSVAYSFTPEYDGWAPFQESKGIKSPYLKWIKDFNVNPIPNNITVRADLDRQFIKTVFRNLEGAQPNYEKFFNFNRTYNVKWNVTKSLSMDYNARTHAVIDELEGEINSDVERSIIWENIKDLGRIRDFNQDVSANYKLPFDKLPFTDWVNGDYRYSAGYTWTAGTYIPDEATFTIDEQDSLNFGGIIENNRGQAVTGKFDLVKLYNKVKILKDVNTPPRRTRANSRAQAADTVKDIHDYKFAKGFLRTLMMVRSVNATYSLDEGTLLPGFDQTPSLFGLDDAFDAPGVPFILGSQNTNIRTEASNKNWIVNNQELTNTFSQSRSINLSIKARIEPFKDFKIQVDATKRETATYQEIYRFDGATDVNIDNGFRSISPGRSGSYSVSFFTLNTAFRKGDGDNESTTFEEFENNRVGILNRISGINSTFSYDTNSQDVLIPAFIAAYTGKSVDQVSLSPFPKTPIPNWRFDYSGLSKIPALKDIFSSVSITHSYKSSYTVSNYVNSLEYSESSEIDFNNSIEDYNTTQFGSIPNENDGNVVPRYIIGQVLISEQFAPLIGVNLRTKGRATIKVEYKKQRDLSLQLTNNQITEQRSNDIVLEYGFTKANFKLPIKSQGRVVTLKNDLQFRIGFTIKNNITIQRKLENPSTVTDGRISYQVNQSFDYVLNKKINLRFYFTRDINEPKTSRAFKTTRTSFGFQLRFSLAQ
jgi:cell surface protein SprA